MSLGILLTIIKKTTDAFNAIATYARHRFVVFLNHPSAVILGIIFFFYLIYSIYSFCVKNEQLLLNMWNTSDLFYSSSFYFIIVFFSILYSSYLGVRGVYITCGLGIAFSWCTQISNLDYFFTQGGLKSFTLWQGFTLLDFIELDFYLVVDKISFSFLLLTTSIGLCASIYSLTYFKNEPHADRFILLLHSFILSMSLLVTADNVFLMFLGWELIGLTSFMLINFWTLRRGTLKAAFKAFVFNKLSDIFILFFILLMVNLTQSASFQVWIKLIQLSELGSSDYVLPILFLILGSSIKSAQIIGHLWLPDSMEAPIPASALIHSATLVSAGVYLLLRTTPILYSAGLNDFVFVLGSVTAFYGAVVSAAQTDAKKLLAYSTISHCGFLFVTISFNSLNLTILYLYLHGFFKALTFFCIGNIIKVAGGNQDTRTMGQFAQLLPVESILFIISSINLGGLPFTVGFFYKHIFQALLLTNSISKFFFIFLFLAMLVSIIYVFRLVYYVLFDFKKGPKMNYSTITTRNLQFSKYSNTTSFSYLSVSLFLLFAFYIYVTYIYLVPFASDINQLELFSSLPNFGVLTLLAFSCFTLFCSAFFSIICLLFLLDCRFEFSTLNKKFIFFYFFLFLAFFIVLI